MNGENPFVLNPDSPDLWRKFIDPVHWQQALSEYPRSPWEFYLKPRGNYSIKEWEYYQTAAHWVWKKAAEHRSLTSERLSLKELLELNAAVMLGDVSRWQTVLRHSRPIFNYRSTEEILRVYEKGSCFYANEDGLSLKVEGFWPAEEKSVDFFASCRALAAVSFDENPEGWEKAFCCFKSMLHGQISERSSKWQVYFLTRHKDLTHQMETLLDWYDREAELLLLSQKSNHGLDLQALLELCVKMQRYLDIAQFSMDGSGRTSKLLQDYIFLRFGYLPPAPVLYEAYGRVWENGTYLQLKEAVQMVQRGWTGMRLEKNA